MKDKDRNPPGSDPGFRANRRSSQVRASRQQILDRPDFLFLFDNLLDVAKIAKDIEARFRKTGPAVTALMIRSHGPTVWGASLQEAYNRFEILEFILRYQTNSHR